MFLKLCFPEHEVTQSVTCLAYSQVKKGIPEKNKTYNNVL